VPVVVVDPIPEEVVVPVPAGVDVETSANANTAGIKSAPIAKVDKSTEVLNRRRSALFVIVCVVMCSFFIGNKVIIINTYLINVNY
jgi:hypothetical protein